MNPPTQQPVQPALAPQAQAYGTQAQQMLTDPNITQAGQTVSNLQQEAGASSAAEQTLPQLLQQSLTGSMNQNDVDVQKAKTDLATYLSDLGNPQGAADTAAAAVPGAVLSPTQQRAITSAKLGNEAANLSSDNLIMGLRLGGIANIIHSASATQAANTQQLLAKLQAAQTTYQQLFDKANASAQLAMHLSDSAQQADQFTQSLGIQKGQLGIAQQQLAASIAGNPTIQGAKAVQEAQGDVKSMSKTEFYNKWVGNPFLSAAQASAIWNAAHPTQPVNFGIQGTTSATTGGITSLQQLLPGLFGLLGGGNQNNSRPPLSNFDQ